MTERFLQWVNIDYVLLGAIAIMVAAMCVTVHYAISGVLSLFKKGKDKMPVKMTPEQRRAANIAAKAQRQVQRVQEQQAIADGIEDLFEKLEKQGILTPRRTAWYTNKLATCWELKDLLPSKRKQERDRYIGPKPWSRWTRPFAHPQLHLKTEKFFSLLYRLRGVRDGTIPIPGPKNPIPGKPEPIKSPNKLEELRARRQRRRQASS